MFSDAQDSFMKTMIGDNNGVANQINGEAHNFDAALSEALGVSNQDKLYSATKKEFIPEKD